MHVFDLHTKQERVLRLDSILERDAEHGSQRRQSCWVFWTLLTSLFWVCRRAHLRDCLELLKELVPSPPDHQKATTLALLQSAEQYIKVTVSEQVCVLLQEAKRSVHNKGASHLHITAPVSLEISARSSVKSLDVFGNETPTELCDNERKRPSWNSSDSPRWREQMFCSAGKTQWNQMEMQISAFVRIVACWTCGVLYFLVVIILYKNIKCGRNW